MGCRKRPHCVLRWCGCQEQGALSELPEVARQKLDEVPFFREPRPRHTAMDNTRLTTELGIPMPTAAEAIATVTRRFLANAEF